VIVLRETFASLRDCKCSEKGEQVGEERRIEQGTVQRGEREDDSLEFHVEEEGAGRVHEYGIRPIDASEVGS